MVPPTIDGRRRTVPPGRYLVRVHVVTPRDHRDRHPRRMRRRDDLPLQRRRPRALAPTAVRRRAHKQINGHFLRPTRQRSDQTRRNQAPEKGGLGRRDTLRLRRHAGQQHSVERVPRDRPLALGCGPSAAEASATSSHGPRSIGWRNAGSQDRVSFIHGQAYASPSNTQGGSRMRECCTYGSERGAPSNGRPYRDPTLTRTLCRAPQSSVSAIRACHGPAAPSISALSSPAHTAVRHGSAGVAQG